MEQLSGEETCMGKRGIWEKKIPIIVFLGTAALFFFARTAVTEGAFKSSSFTRDLTVGSRGNDVRALQQTLFDRKYLTTSPTGFSTNDTRKER